MTYSFGVYYAEFLTYFDEGSAKTAWIVSILVGITLSSGKYPFYFQKYDTTQKKIIVKKVKRLQIGLLLCLPYLADLAVR